MKGAHRLSGCRIRGTELKVVLAYYVKIASQNPVRKWRKLAGVAAKHLAAKFNRWPACGSQALVAHGFVGSSAST